MTTSTPKPHKDEIKYQEVVTIAQQLETEGRKVTHRAIREKLGRGSFSDIGKHRARWLEEKEQASAANTVLSDTFQQAVLAEIGRATKALKEQHQSLLAEYKDQLTESQEMIEEDNRELENIKQQSQDHQEAARTKEIDFEKRLAAAQALVKQATDQENTLRQELKGIIQQYETRVSEVIDARHHAELKAERASTRAEELEKQLNELKMKLTEEALKK